MRIIIRILAVVALVVLINRLTNDNAFAVYLDGQFIAYIQIEETRDPDELAYAILDHARRSLENHVNSDVRIFQSQIHLEPTRASSRDHVIRATLITMIRNQLTYERLVSAIYVDGERYAILRTRDEAEQVIEALVDRYRNEYTIEYSFSRNVEIRQIPFHDDILVNSRFEAVSILRQPTRVLIEHVIQPGEDLLVIARMHDTTLEDIHERNVIPDDNNIHHLSILLVESIQPLLLVYTVDQFIDLEIIPPEYEEVENPNLGYGQTVIITQGIPGQRQVEIRRTFINGIQDGEDEIDYNIILLPLPGVLEIGTAVIDR